MLTLLFHTASTLCLVGLIWVIQAVHYPLFHRVDPEHFREFAREHQRRISWIVMPLMTSELVSAALLLANPPLGLGRDHFGWGMVLLGIIWSSTALIQMPLHLKLSQGYDPVAIQRLVLGNWIRTLAWTGRGILVILTLIQVIA